MSLSKILSDAKARIGDLCTQVKASVQGNFEKLVAKVKACAQAVFASCGNFGKQITNKFNGLRHAGHTAIALTDGSEVFPVVLKVEQIEHAPKTQDVAEKAESAKSEEAAQTPSRFSQFVDGVKTAARNHPHITAALLAAGLFGAGRGLGIGQDGPKATLKIGFLDDTFPDNPLFLFGSPSDPSDLHFATAVHLAGMDRYAKESSAKVDEDAIVMNSSGPEWLKLDDFNPNSDAELVMNSAGPELLKSDTLNLLTQMYLVAPEHELTPAELSEARAAAIKAKAFAKSQEEAFDPTALERNLREFHLEQLEQVGRRNSWTHYQKAHNDLEAAKAERMAVIASGRAAHANSIGEEAGSRSAASRLSSGHNRYAWQKGLEPLHQQLAEEDSLLETRQAQELVDRLTAEQNKQEWYQQQWFINEARNEARKGRNVSPIATFVDEGERIEKQNNLTELRERFAKLDRIEEFANGHIAQNQAESELAKANQPEIRATLDNQQFEKLVAEQEKLQKEVAELDGVINAREARKALASVASTSVADSSVIPAGAVVDGSASRGNKFDDFAYVEFGAAEQEPAAKGSEGTPAGSEGGASTTVVAASNTQPTDAAKGAEVAGNENGNPKQYFSNFVKLG